MTSSDYRKVFVQLNNKPEIKKKYLKHNAPKKRTTGELLKKCRRCGRTGGHVSKYGINLCRQCFREIAKKIGFKKYM